MKKNILSLLLLGIFSCTVSAKKDVVLNKIQNKIDTCFVLSFKNPKAYDDLEKDLTAGYKTAKSENMKSYYLYWLSYMTYYKAVSAFKEADLEKSQKFAEQAMGYLEKMKKKDSEYYSLMAYEQVFYFQFIKRQDMFIFMEKLKKNLKLSMDMGATNPRAYFVNGYYDYYTPKEYGGKKKTEKLLLKAIKMKNSDAPFSPTWGIVDSYSILIQYYIENGNKAKAKAMYQQAIKRFPTSRDILRLKNKL